MDDPDARAKADQMSMQADLRLIKIQAHIKVYGSREQWLTRNRSYDAAIRSRRHSAQTKHLLAESAHPDAVPRLRRLGLWWLGRCDWGLLPSTRMLRLRSLPRSLSSCFDRC